MLWIVQKSTTVKKAILKHLTPPLNPTTLVREQIALKCMNSIVHMN